MPRIQEPNNEFDNKQTSQTKKKHTQKKHTENKPPVNVVQEGFIEMPSELLSTQAHPFVYGENFKIYTRPFRMLEVKRLAQHGERITDVIIDEVMREVVKPNNDLTYDDLATADKMNLIFWVRSITYPDPSYKLNYICDNYIDVEEENEYGEKVKTKKKCSSQNAISIEMDDIDINYLKEDLTEEDLTCKLGENTLKFRMPIIRDSKLVEENFKALCKSRGSKNVDKELLATSFLITEINGEVPPNIATVYDILVDTSPADFVKLNTVFRNLECGVDVSIETTCSECGGPVKIPVIFFPEFYVPEYQPE